MTVYVGIDPGASGAIACISEDEIIIRDMAPPAALTTYLLYLEPPIYAAVEEQSFRPGQDVKSTFAQAMNYGVIIGVLSALRIPYETIRPQAWKRQLRIPAGKGATPAEKRKDAKAHSMRVAEAMFPDVQLRGPRGGALDGRAEALLIAVAIRQIKMGDKS